MSVAHQMSSGADVSRLVSEEEIIDTVFETCDVSHTGWVQVSCLVDCVKVVAGSQHDTTQVENDKLKLLVNLLDPSGTNPKISKISYRSGISNWIKMLRHFNEENELSDAVSPVPVVHSAGLFPVSSSSYELSNVTDDYDIIELNNRLEYKEQQNRRLGEELSDLREQLNVSDDLVSQFKQENSQLKHALKCNQSTLDRFSAVRRENEELKISLDGCIEEKKQLKSALTKLEQTNKSLSQNIANLQEQLSMAQSEIENKEDEILNLHQQLNDKTLKLLSLEKTMDAYQLQLVNKSSTIEEIEKKLNALIDMNKNLLKHSSEIEAQLTEKKELLHLQTVELTKRQLCDCFEEEDIEDDIDLMPFVQRHILSPPRQSTPQLRNIVSLHNELTSKIVKEPIFPSPLCDKELESLFSGSSVEDFSAITNDSRIAKFYDDTGMNVCLSPIDTTPTSTAYKRSRKLKSIDYLDVTQMKDSMTREVEVLTEMGISCNTQHYKHSLAAFVDRMTACTVARIAAEQRNVALSTTLRQIQERMEEEGILHHLARQELENHLKSATDSFGCRLKQKNFMIQLEKQRNQDLELKILSMEKRCLSNTKTSIEGDSQVRASMVKDDHQMGPLGLPGNDSRILHIPGNKAVERHVANRLRDSVDKPEAMMMLLVELFREYERCRHRPSSVVPSQMVSSQMVSSQMVSSQMVSSQMVYSTVAHSEEKMGQEDVHGQGDFQRTEVLQVSRRQKSDADSLTAAVSKHIPSVSSCCQTVVSVMIFFTVIVLCGLVHVKDQLGSGRSLWSAFEEIFRPHLSLRHTIPPPF